MQTPSLLSVSGWTYVESLHHVVFDCPEYDLARRSPEILRMLGVGNDVFMVHLGRWSGREIRDILRFFGDLLALREGLGGKGPRRWAELQALAVSNWFCGDGH